MNSFRAFKLKLPKKSDDETSTWNGDIVNHFGNETTFKLDTQVQCENVTAQCFPTPVPLQNNTNGEKSRVLQPVSSYLSPLHGGFSHTSTNEKSSLPQTPSSIIHQHLHPHLLNGLFNPQNVPQPYNEAGTINSSIVQPDIEKRSTETSEAAQQHRFETIAEETIVCDGYSSPPPSNSEASLKCSTTPDSTDSGCPPSSADLLDEPMNETEEMDCKPEGEKREGCFECLFCKRTFSYLCHLKVHERVHTGEKPYACKFCPQHFSQLGSLTVHMRIHTGAKPYQCRECSKNFRHVNSLRRHQRQVHNMSSVQMTLVLDKRMKIDSDQSHVQYSSKNRNLETKQTAYKRKRPSVDTGEFYRQQMFQSFNNRYFDRGNLYTTIAPGLLWPQQSISAGNAGSLNQHLASQGQQSNSKFIRELEGKAKVGSHNLINAHGIQNAAEALLSLSTPTSSSLQKKSPAKTWRPFLSEEDEKTDPMQSQINTKIETKHENYNTNNLFTPPQCSRNASAGKYPANIDEIFPKLPRLIPISVIQREIEMSKPAPTAYFGISKMQHYDARMPPIIWPSTVLNLGSQKQMDLQDHSVADCDTKRNIKTEFQEPRNVNLSLNTSRNTTKEDSSDEGFLSSCSIIEGESRSPGSSPGGLKTTGISDLNFEVGVSSNKYSKASTIYSGHNQAEVPDIGRKWSKDSGI